MIHLLPEKPIASLSLEKGKSGDFFFFGIEINVEVLALEDLPVELGIADFVLTERKSLSSEVPAGCDQHKDAGEKNRQCPYVLFLHAFRRKKRSRMIRNERKKRKGSASGR